MLDIDENPLLNGYFDHVPDDADASITAAGGIGVSWRLNDLGTSGAGTIARNAFTFGQTDVAEDPEYFLRWAQTTGGTSTKPTLLNLIEDVRTFAGEMVTVQGYIKTNVAIGVRLRQDFGAGGSPSADVSTDEVTLPLSNDATGAAVWRPFSATFRLPTVAGKTLGSTANTSYLGVEFRGPLASTFQYDLANVRLVKGGGRDVSKRRPKQLEKQLLDRYYWAATVRAQNGSFHIALPVQMRAAPTVAAGAATADNATVDGFNLTHTAAANVAATADARMSA